jgi:hypothetical protein
MNQFAIHFDMIAPRRLRAKILAGLTVNGHPAGGDQLIAATA